LFRVKNREKSDSIFGKPVLNMEIHGKIDGKIPKIS